MKTKVSGTRVGLFALGIAAGLAVGVSNGLAQLDYGDAPDGPYPTLKANDGASHIAIGPLLGTERDAEADGQPSADAMGDDLAGGGDDEDGVVFTSVLLPGEFAKVTVTTSGTGPYILNAWMDFNDDGDWLDPGERIFANTGLALGENEIQFPVPSGVTLGPSTYSRWRLNTIGGLQPDGAAFDGEVEDYGIGSIHGQKWYDQNGDGIKDLDEPGLNGWEVHLYDSTGTTLITSTVTQDMDLDGDGIIDRFTERGLYWIGGVAAESYIVREAPHPTATQTFPVAGEHPILVTESQIIEDLDFGNTGILIRPDCRIGRKPIPATHKFNDVYLPARQLLRCKGKVKRPVKWFVSIENDGDVTDVIGAKSKRPSRKFRMTFSQFGRGNVTGLLRSGRYLTQLDPGKVRVIKATARAKDRRSPRRLTLRNWITAGSKTDLVVDRVNKLAKLKGAR